MKRVILSAEAARGLIFCDGGRPCAFTYDRLAEPYDEFVRHVRTLLHHIRDQGTTQTFTIRCAQNHNSVEGSWNRK